MAYASSTLEAQEVSIQVCDLCEDKEDVNWFCKDCVQNLCDRCRKIHLKTIACKNHQIISILEGVAITKKNVSNLCQYHDDLFLYFCRTCDKNICSMCLSMIHKKHDFVDLRHLQSELQFELDAILKKKRLEQTEMIKNIDALDACENRCKSTLFVRYALIDDKIEAIKTAADEEGDNLRLSLQSTTDRYLKEIQERKQNLVDRKNAYVEQFELIQQDLRLQTASTFQEFVKSSTSKLQSLTPLSYYEIPRSSTFTSGHIEKELIRNMIGQEVNLQDVSDLFEKQGRSNSLVVERKKRNVILPKLKILSIHNLDVLRVNTEKKFFSICESSCGNFLLGGWHSVYKVSPDFSSILLHFPVRTFCRNIACLNSGDIIVTYGYSSSYLSRLTSVGRTDETRNLSPMYVFDIAVTHNDEFVVALYNGSSSRPVSSLAIFSKKGKVNEIKIDKELGSFCISKNGLYIISDSTSTFLTAFDVSGSPLKKIQTTKPYLKRLRSDMYGNLVGVPVCTDICSTHDKGVHVISENGQIERSFHVECEKSINDICIDNGNRLLILIDDDKVIVADYLEED